MGREDRLGASFLENEDHDARHDDRINEVYRGGHPGGDIHIGMHQSRPRRHVKRRQQGDDQQLSAGDSQVYFSNQHYGRHHRRREQKAVE